MNHDEHVLLIAAGIARDSGGRWADLGAGGGAFTLALRDLAGPQVEIIAVDQDGSALRELRAAMERRFPATRLRTVTADFTRPLALPPLDGIIAANAIHFVADQVTLLRRWRAYLKPGAPLILVEYDAERGNQWVPYLRSFAALGDLAGAAGFASPRLLGVRPSRFLDRIYAAALTSLPDAAPGDGS